MIPIGFEYISNKYGLERKVHISILRQFQHYYTGVTMLYVRKESSDGMMWEGFMPEEEYRRLLELRVKE